MGMAAGFLACRLCLSFEGKRSFYPLLDQESFEDLKFSLDLITDLCDENVHPRMICDSCSDITQQFIKLKKLALENERLILKYQKQIQKHGVKYALENNTTVVKKQCSKIDIDL